MAATAAESVWRSLRKTARGAALPRLSDLENSDTRASLCEVLDRRHAPLCLLPGAAVRSQNLLHHEIILFGLAGNRLLLKAGAKADIPLIFPLPAGKAILDAARAMTPKAFGLECPCRHLADLPPGDAAFGGIGHLVAAILSPGLAEALLNPDLALFAPEDLPALANRGLLGQIPELLWGRAA